MADLTSPNTDLEGWKEQLPEIMRSAEFDPLSSVPDDVPPEAVALEIMQYPVMAQVLTVQAVFLLLEGKQTESLNLLSSLFCLGQLIADSGYPIQAMSAASILPTVAQGLELQVLNAWETTESRKLMAQVLNDLDARIPPGIRG